MGRGREGEGEGEVKEEGRKGGIGREGGGNRIEIRLHDACTCTCIYIFRTWQERLTETERRKKEELEELKVRNF